MLLLALLAAAAPLIESGGARDDVPAQLARLDAPAAAERLDAQRWLSVHLARDDFPLVAERARAGGVEVCRRLAQAVGADDRNLGLAALLLTDRDPAVSEVGERALAERIAAWSASCRDRPLAPRTLPEGWSGNRPRPLALDADSVSLGELVDRLDRLGGGPAPLVLDPSLDPAVRAWIPERPRGPGSAPRSPTGSWSALLTQLTSLHGVSFEVLGQRGPEEAQASRARAWVRVCKRGDEGARGDGDTVGHLVGWMRGVLREHDPRWNAACARALATSGWPGAVRWLAERWGREGDPAALEGLLAAAARGRVAPALGPPARLRRLLTEADRRLAERGVGALAHAERLARALAQLPPLDPRGEPLVGVLLEDWATLGPGSRWVRLVALEGQGRADPRAARVCRDLLSRPGSSGLRIQALRTLLRVQPADAPPVALADPRALLARARRSGGLDELARLLVATAARPLEGERVGPGRTLEERGVVLVWAATTGARARALEALRASLAADGPVALARRLRGWEGLGLAQPLRAVVAQGRAAFARANDDTPARLERFALHAGLLTAGEQRALFEQLTAGGTPGGEGLLDLGVLAAAEGDVGARARGSIHAALRADVSAEELRRAVELAVAGLRRARRDAQNEDFQSRLRSTAARTDHPLRSFLLRLDWPPEERRPPLALEERERRLDL